ncbi:19143_t:CDS:2 [Gigaspora margarita]|uniref:19143_t:CDS:1 n=1 Tax=Gigaspora margarita TaxID=4874 RepID=A0ABN7UDU0_GIGMA|nr:19143_t:CDS:2 [Gigaspora margarita]
MLGKGEYAAMFYMFSDKFSLRKLLNIANNTQVPIDLDNSDTVFNKDQELKEEIEYVDESEILDNESEAKINQKKSITHKSAIIWNKKIEFATYLQRLEAKNYLISKYDIFKEQELTPINIMQTDDLEKEKNVLLATIQIVYERISVICIYSIDRHNDSQISTRSKHY